MCLGAAEAAEVPLAHSWRTTALLAAFGKFKAQNQCKRMGFAPVRLCQAQHSAHPTWHRPLNQQRISPTLTPEFISWSQNNKHSVFPSRATKGPPASLPTPSTQEVSICYVKKSSSPNMMTCPFTWSSPRLQSHKSDSPALSPLRVLTISSSPPAWE